MLDQCPRMPAGTGSNQQMARRELADVAICGNPSALSGRLSRRLWLVLAGAAALVMPVRAQVQRNARLGMIHVVERDDPQVMALLGRLTELGWVEGRTLAIEYRVQDRRPSELPRTVQELVQLKCDVIVTTNTPATLAAKVGAPEIPLVFTVGGDPVALKVVASMARPGGNATGVTQMSAEANLKQLSLLKEVVPAATRVAVMYDAGNASMLQVLKSMQGAASKLQIELLPLPLRDWRDVDAAPPLLQRGDAKGLIVLPGIITGTLGFSIGNLAHRLHLPTIYSERRSVKAEGGLMSYGPDSTALYKRLADKVAQILNGEKPANMPVEQPTQFELFVSLSAARSQGIHIPQSVLLQATEVIR